MLLSLRLRHFHSGSITLYFNCPSESSVIIFPEFTPLHLFMPIVRILMYYYGHNICVLFVKDILVGLCVILFPSVLMIAHESLELPPPLCRRVEPLPKTVRMKYFTDGTVRFSRMYRKTLKRLASFGHA